MFWKKGKSRQAELEELLKAETDKLVEIITGKWVQFQTLLPFRADVPLADRIEAFIMPVSEGILQNFPIMRSAPAEVIWEMVFLAVLQSKTHSADEVSKAREVLAAKYAQG